MTSGAGWPAPSSLTCSELRVSMSMFCSEHVRLDETSRKYVIKDIIAYLLTNEGTSTQGCWLKPQVRYVGSS